MMKTYTINLVNDSSLRGLDSVLEKEHWRNGRSSGWGGLGVQEAPIITHLSSNLEQMLEDK